MRVIRSINTIQSVPCINGQPVVLPDGNWTCSNAQPPNIDYYPPVLPINCNHHQAPSGYQYLFRNGRCVLFNRATGQPVVAQSGQGQIVGITAITNTLTALPSTLSNWYQNNKTLALILASTAIYFFTKKK